MAMLHFFGSVMATLHLVTGDKGGTGKRGKGRSDLLIKSTFW